MKKNLLSLIIFLFTVHCSLITLQAQAPQGFNYQAVARDGDNNLLKNAALNVKIGLLQGSETGTLVWEETHSVTTNDLGLFTLTIGDTTAIKNGGSAATFADIDWTQGSYYMAVQVNNDVDLGSTELLSVPYALFAEAGNEGPAGPQGSQGEQGAPGDPATDDQTLSIEGHQLSISGGNFVNLPDTVNDADHDPANEIQDLQLSENDLSITNKTSPTVIDLTKYLDNTDYWTKNGDIIYVTGTNVGIGTTSPGGRLQVKGETIDDEEPLFEVKNKDGQTVFAVYNNGVRVYVDDSNAKGPKGGFAVGGFSSAKGGSEYLRVTPDSVRIYIDTAAIKGPKGGFAVGGFSTVAKGLTSEYLRITDDSIRIYLNNTEGKGPKGGFAVGGFSPGKGPENDFFRVTNDSTRIYTTGAGGFSVGEIGGGSIKYINMTPENYFIGHQSGINTTPAPSGEGKYNSFFGYESGMENTVGSHNLFMGYQSGFKNIYGKNNVFLGIKAGYENTGTFDSDYLGCHNVFIGYLSGQYNTEGQSNVFIGKQCGWRNDVGRYNVFIGQNTAVQNTDGHFNTYIGAHSAESKTGGDYNTFIGYGSGGQNGDGAGNVFIGRSAGYYESGSNLLYIDNSNTATPLIWGNFATDSEEVVINGNSDYNLNERTFYVNGTAGGLGAWNIDSDIRLKENIITIPYALKKVIALRGVNFNWRNRTERGDDLHMGFIAQEAVKVIPEVVGNNKNHYDMQYAPITALLVEAVKEQQKLINEMQKQIEILKSTIESVKNDK